MAKKNVADLTKALIKAKEVETKTEAHLQEVIAHGRCDDDCPPIQATNGSSQPTPGLNGSTQLRPQQEYVLPPSTPICWRIAFRLLENPELDYQCTAEAIWGSGLKKMVAKNRVNAQLTRLKTLRVIDSLGGNRYKVNVAKLVELSKIPVPPEAAAMMN